MSTSTDGQLSYGVLFDQGFRFPWDTKDGHGSLNDWWLEVKGFKPTYYPYTEEGDHKEDATELLISEYYNQKAAWKKATPLPVFLINYCSCDYPMYILASKHIECSRGYPEEINIDFLQDTQEAHAKLIQFLEEFGIEHEDKPRWLLSSYWG
jgi:hypothetical protein